MERQAQSREIVQTRGKEIINWQPKPDFRQQRKIVATLARNFDPDIMNFPDVEISPQEKANVYSWLRANGLNEDHYRTLLANVSGPSGGDLQAAEAVFLSDSKLKGYKDQIFQQGASSHVDEDVVSFGRYFFEQLKATSEHERARVGKAWDMIGILTFGKKWEYYRQMQFLKEQAAGFRPDLLKLKASTSWSFTDLLKKFSSGKKAHSVGSASENMNQGQIKPGDYVLTIQEMQAQGVDITEWVKDREGREIGLCLWRRHDGKLFRTQVAGDVFSKAFGLQKCRVILTSFKNQG